MASAPKGFGLAAEYFEGEFARSVLVRVDPEINAFWQWARPAAVGDKFSIRWKGFLRAPQAGKYRIIASHDDGIRVFIDQKPVMDQWGGPGVHQALADLTGKPQALLVEYRNLSGEARVSLQWQPLEGGGRPTVIPWTALFTDVATAQNAP
jgi:hypothetical protein